MQFQPAPFQNPAYHNHNHHHPQQQHNTHNHHHHHHHNHHHDPRQHSAHPQQTSSHSINKQQQQQQLNLSHNPNNKQHKFLIEKYNRKYNLISFILLRKNDEYLADCKYYLNDQSLYQQVDSLIERRQLDQLTKLFSNNINKTNIDEYAGLCAPSLTNFTNSYNCNLFVYTIRKCLEFESHSSGQPKPIELDENNNEIEHDADEADNFTSGLIEMLFRKESRPRSFFLIDGDFPKRNIMHYAATYNCTLIPQLVLSSCVENEAFERRRRHSLARLDLNDEDSQSVEAICGQLLTRLTDTICDELEAAGSDDINSNGELILIQLCSQVDFNGNTPVHLAAMNDSYDLLKLINPLCIRYSQFVYNEDGLNPFLLACRHASVKFIRHLIEQQQQQPQVESDQFLANTELDLLKCRDKVNFKNCLHYACGRGCSKDALSTIKYLTQLTASHSRNTAGTSLNELIGAMSPLIGSVYHAAASNLTRLSTLWYLLNLYPQEGLRMSAASHSILNELDFREFTCVDCLVDSVMNLREMAPPHCTSLSTFYELLIDQTEHSTPPQPEFEFSVLLSRCMYKLAHESQASMFNLPRVKNQWQLLEFMRLLVLLSKFSKISSVAQDIEQSPVKSFDRGYGQNFELLCVNFLNSFVATGDILSFDKASDSAASPADVNELFILVEIGTQLYELTSTCLMRGYGQRFNATLASFYANFTDKLTLYEQKIEAHLEAQEKLDTTTFVQLKSRLTQLKSKSNQLNVESRSLKHLCRIKINNCISDKSLLSASCGLFRLPGRYSTVLNYLSFNLIEDLYGADHQLNPC